MSSMKFYLKINPDVQQVMNQLELLVRFKAGRKALQDASPVTQASLTNNAPDSQKSTDGKPPTRIKWSQAFRRGDVPSKTGGPGWTDVSSHEHIRIKAKEGNVAPYVVIGGDSEKANKLNFNLPGEKKGFVRQQFFWGDKAKSNFIRKDRWISDSWAETEQEFVNKFGQSLKTQVESTKIG